MNQLKYEDILRRLGNTEDSTVERKSANDYRDCLKTAVGFSNSMPIGDPAIIFVGVQNDGIVQSNLNLDTLQMSVSKELSKIYPPIFPQMRVLKHEDGKEFLAVIVRGSENRPHFAGQAYVRDGSQTIVASEEQFRLLIAERNSKAHQILGWGNRNVILRMPEGKAMVVGNTLYRGRSNVPCRVIECNQFYVTLEFGSTDAEKVVRSHPLTFIEINYDAENKKPELIVLPY